MTDKITQIIYKQNKIIGLSENGNLYSLEEGAEGSDRYWHIYCYHNDDLRQKDKSI